MNLPLSSSSDLQARKELARLRLEMHRQQLRYHAQPLSSPIDQAKAFFKLRHSRQRHGIGGKGPLLLVSTALLALFGKKLGKLGTLARLGITLYPLIKAQQKLRHEN